MRNNLLMIKLKHKIRKIAPLLVALLIGYSIVSSFAGAQETPRTTEEDLPMAIPAEAFKEPKMESIIAQIVHAHESKRDGLQRFAIVLENDTLLPLFVPLDEIVTKDDKIRVVIELAEDASLDGYYIAIEARYKNLVQALVPVSAIRELAEDTAVHYIRRPYRPYSTAITSEGVSVINADELHAMGIKGNGVKIAIIDVGFEGYDKIPDEIPPANIIEVKSFRADGDIEAGVDHGTACAEVLLDVVPDAGLYLFNFDTEVEFADAVNYAISKKVNIISSSVGWPFGPFDGTWLFCDIVNDAHANGIFWAQAAGNAAQNHWEGSFYDSDGDNWHNFMGSDEVLIIEAPYYFDGTYYWYPFGIFLSWDEDPANPYDDWSHSDQDYDLYLLTYYQGAWYVLGNSTNFQTGTQLPIEVISGWVVTDFELGPCGVAIKKYGATKTVHFELYTNHNYNTVLEYNVYSSSLISPADAAGAVTAGATYWGNDSLESFSSQGPTNDGRTKPDVTAPDGVSTYTHRPSVFYGTSASAPHTAGAAALLLSANQSLTADQLQSYLESAARDVGTPGKDNLYGAGRIDVLAAYRLVFPTQPPQVRVIDTPAVTVVPGETYTSYNITFTVNRSDSSWTNLSWLNITGMNQSISNPGDISAIRNISVVLNTTGENIVNYARSTSLPALDWPITLNLSNKGIGNDTTNTTVNLSIYLTLNTSGLTDGANIALNASLYAWANAASPWFWGSANNTNDPAPERIEVLDTRAGVSNTTAWEGDMNVLCANVTIIPGNRTVPSYLRAITFNTTANTTLNAACIERFALWNDTNANERFDAGDTLIAATSPTDGVNVTFYLSALPLANRTIPAGVNGTFFLTMNATRPGSYQAIIHAQNITINQSGTYAGNTGNSTVTAGFTTLTINPILKVTGIYDADGANSVVPGATYIAYNFTYRDGNNTLGTNLTWFNLTGWNTSIISSNVTFTDILNITLWNTTIPANPVYIGHTSSPAGFNISINLSNYWVPQNNTANITITISLNTGGLVDGEQIAFNASLTYIANATSSVWNRTVEERANDPAAERIEVLDATAGASRTIAWEGDPNVLCANVTIVPGNRTATSYLKAITFNTTADSTLNAAYIECFALWNDTNADEIFDPAADALITTISTPGGVNVTFDLAALPLENRTIPGGANGRFFLTMNITETAHTGRYQAQILAQKIVLNQSSSSGGGGGNGGGGGLGIIEGNTGNDSATIGFTLLWIDPVDVRVYDGPKEYVRANETYVAYTITYQENTTDVGGAHLTWFNVTGMTLSVPNLCDISTITTVSVLNSTSGTYLGNATRLSTSPYFTVNLDNAEVADNGTYDLTILVSLNTSPNLIQGQNISLTARLYDDETHNLSADDPAPETIDMIAPTVTAHSPIGTGVSITTSVSVTFSEPMDLLTINTTTFTLDSVTGTVTYDAGTRTATFDPTSNLDYSKTYTAIITTGATDLAGNSLAESYSWSFTTEAAPTQPVRGAGGGGGGGGGAPFTFPNIPVDPATGRVTSITTLSADGATLTIPAGAILKDAAGKPLSRITSGYLPTIAEQIGAISAYDFGPAGATFTPPIDLVIAYDPAKLSTGFSESDLVIRMWDGTAWVDLETSVNTVVHTATAKVAHFTLFGLFAVPHAAPAPAPTPSVTPEATPEITPTPAQPRQMPGGIVVVPLALAAALIIVAVAYLMLKKGIIKPKMREKK